jgi:activating signal cointegrator complex subunit 2
MLDACSLFSALSQENNTTEKPFKNQLTAALSGMVSLRPALHLEFPPTAIATAENLLKVVEACVSAAPAARKDPEMLRNLADGVTYAKDACISLCALIEGYPPTAGLFLKNPSCQQLIEALGAVHDELLPLVENIASTGLGRGKEPSSIHANLATKCLQIEVASEAAVVGLIRNAYLDASIEDITGGSSSSGGGSGSSSKPSINPAAIQRGEALLHSFTLLGHREVNTAAAAAGAGGTGGGGLSLAPALTQRHGIGGTIQKAVMAGIVVLDEAQTDYIAALLDVSSLAAAPVVVLTNDTHNGATTNTNSYHTGESAFSDGGNSTRNTTKSSTDREISTDMMSNDDSAVLLSLVSQVKDLLPEFGEGYIASCLDALDRNPERVINALLEGNLPQDVVESVDSQLTFEKYEKIKKEKMIAEAAFPVLPGSTTRATTESMSTQQQQEQQRKRNNDSLTAKYLDTKETTYAEKIKAAAIQSQWEYEDEYDDSYDELLHIGADGVAEGEGGGEEEEKLATMQHATAALGGLSLAEGNRNPPAGRGGGGSNTRGGGRGGRSTRGKGGKVWVLDGRVYNYAKPGAKEVASEADANALIQQAEQAAREIHGLGPGGNKPGSNRRFATSGGGGGGAAPVTQQEGEEAAGEQPNSGGDGSGRGGGSGGRGSRGGGRGAGSGSSHNYKDKNKAAIGNHHRKDRAAQKMSRGM